MGDLFETKAESKAVATAGTAIQEDKLLAILADKGNMEMFKEYLDLKAREEARLAEKMFDEHFAAMQAELPIIMKDRSAKDKNGKQTYAYATLENVLEKCAPIISKHGFSYSWRNESIAEKSTRVWCAIAGYGHKRESYFDIPIMAESSWTNAIQQMGSSTSYGKRYSLCNALGIIIKDEDDDAHSFDLEEIMASAQPLAEIKAVQSLDELAKIWPGIYNEYKTDDGLLKLLIEAKDARKKALK